MFVQFTGRELYEICPVLSCPALVLYLERLNSWGRIKFISSWSLTSAFGGAVFQSTSRRGVFRYDRNDGRNSQTVEPALERLRSGTYIDVHNRKPSR